MSSWLLLAVVDSLLSELKPGVQENTRGLSVKIWRVGEDLCGLEVLTGDRRLYMLKCSDIGSV
jgi:hypothetical protein